LPFSGFAAGGLPDFAVAALRTVSVAAPCLAAPTMRWIRSPSTLSEVSSRRSFLRTTPEKKPRTECCCRPVFLMIAAMVAPFGDLSMAITSACLESDRARG
jgi:hypothetical protein